MSLALTPFLQAGFSRHLHIFGGIILIIFLCGCGHSLKRGPNLSEKGQKSSIPKREAASEDTQNPREALADRSTAPMAADYSGKIPILAKCSFDEFMYEAYVEGDENGQPLPEIEDPSSYAVYFMNGNERNGSCEEIVAKDSIEAPLEKLSELSVSRGPFSPKIEFRINQEVTAVCAFGVHFARIVTLTARYAQVDFKDQNLNGSCGMISGRYLSIDDLAPLPKPIK